MLVAALEECTIKIVNIYMACPLLVVVVSLASFGFFLLWGFTKMRKVPSLCLVLKVSGYMFSMNHHLS